MSDEEIKPIYANVIKIGTGPFDITLDFGYKSLERAEKGSADYEVVSRVVMSLTHAKTMLPLLVEHIAKYEEQFGTIPAPTFKKKEGK